MAPNRYELDLSNEVLNIHFKGEQNCGCPNCINFDFIDFREYSPVHHYIKRSLEPKRSQHFFDCKLCNIVTLQPFDLKEYTVPHLKDLIHIYLEPEDQGSSMTFYVLFSRLKYPQIIA